MKFKFTLLILLCSIFAKSQTNVYHPFPDSGAIWNFHATNYCFVLGDMDEYYSLIYDGDSSINNISYHKLVKPDVLIVGSTICSYGAARYMGGIRQDTSLRTVYFVPPGDTLEQLLYDFKLNVGDTIRGYLNEFFEECDTIISIDSVLVGSDYRKRWYTNSWYNVHIIEGIGSNYGLVERDFCQATDMPSFTMDCASATGLYNYPNPGVACQVISGLSSLESNKNLIRITPNPATSKISINAGNLNVKQVEFYSEIGELVYSSKLEMNNEIDIETLSSGFYFVKCISENNIYSILKVIKL